MMRRRRRVRDDSGAAALEFALVVPVLLLLVFGIIDYGIFFSDTLAVRSGVREAARTGVVGDCPTMACLVDATKANIDPIGGATTYVKIDAPSGWAHGRRLTVCAQVKVDGVTGLTPLLPNDAVTTSRVQMRIEQDVTIPDADRHFAEAPPSGGSWDFCP